MHDSLISVEEIHRILQEIKHFTATATESFYELGLRFKKLKDLKAHKAMGFRRWREFIESYTSFDGSHVDSLIAVVEKFGNAIEASGQVIVSFRRLREALPYVKSESDAEAWLHKARELPSRGWKDELLEAKGLTTTDNCLHSETELWSRCKKCGKFFKE